MSFNVQRLKELRGKLGLSQSELSKLSGVPTGTIKALEAGNSKQPTYKTVAPIARVLGINLDELFFESAC